MTQEFVGTGSPLTADGLRGACDRLSVSAAEIWTVLEVERLGCGFLPDRGHKSCLSVTFFIERLTTYLIRRNSSELTHS